MNAVPASTNQGDRNQDVDCDHCGLPVAAADVQADEAQQFCCGGCRVAYQVIHGCGLQDYYRHRSLAADSAQAAAGRGDAYAAFNTPAFLAKHAQPSAAGLMAIELRLEGVHCAACVWLVERLPSVLPGVIEARLSLNACSARVVWDPAQVELSEIAVTLDKFGYAPHPARDTSAREARLATERRRLARMAVAGALAGNNMLIALALYAGVFDGMETQFARYFRAVSMLMGWLSLAWPGAVFFQGAWASLRARASSLDQPIALALGVGGVAGTINVLLDRGDVYFDSLSVLVFLLLVGRFLQARQQRWASDAVGMAVALTPDACRVVRGDRVEIDSVEALTAGDLVEVLPGDLFPADGEIVTGRSAMEAALLTGESTPSPVVPGDQVFSGATNVGGVLRIKVTAVGENSRVGELQKLVTDGLHARTPLVQFTDRVARWFVLAVMLIAVLNFAAWALTLGVTAATDATVAVLIVACPCALGLATPLTMALAVGRASRDGMLVKSADVFERLAAVGRRQQTGLMLFDKTGTLTRGQPEVIDWHGDPGWIRVAAGAERWSKHPVAKALVRYAQTVAAEPVDVKNVREEHGYGLLCEWAGQTVRIGSAAWVLPHASQVPDELLAAMNREEIGGRTVLAITSGEILCGVICLSDQIHPDVARSLAALQKVAWDFQILSGDHPSAVAAVAREIGLHPTHAHGQMTPEAKFHFVQDATPAEPGRPIVAMVGDGVNDAAALAAADIGIAVHGGAETALAAADVYLSKPGIGSVVGLVAMAKRTMHTARRNLLLSLAYNMAAVTLACGGHITALMAAVIMPLSSATVLLSSIASLTGRSRRP